MKQKIDPNNPLSEDDFCELFEQLPLNDKEREDVKIIYWQIYSTCLGNPDVTPADAWLATRNTFIAHETQVGERVQEQKEN